MSTKNKEFEEYLTTWSKHFFWEFSERLCKISWLKPNTKVWKLPSIVEEQSIIHISVKDLVNLNYQ